MNPVRFVSKKKREENIFLSDQAPGHKGGETRLSLTLDASRLGDFWRNGPLGMGENRVALSSKEFTYPP